MTLLPLEFWIAVLIAGSALILSGCSTPERTTRNCVIAIGQQVAPNAFTSTLYCEREEPVKEKTE